MTSMKIFKFRIYQKNILKFKSYNSEVSTYIKDERLRMLKQIIDTYMKI